VHRDRLWWMNVERATSPAAEPDHGHLQICRTPKSSWWRQSCRGWVVAWGSWPRVGWRTTWYAPWSRSWRPCAPGGMDAGRLRAGQRPRWQLLLTGSGSDHQPVAV